MVLAFSAGVKLDEPRQFETEWRFPSRAPSRFHVDEALFLMTRYAPHEQNHKCNRSFNVVQSIRDTDSITGLPNNLFDNNDQGLYEPRAKLIH